MKISIQAEGQHTVLKIDNIDLSSYVRGFSLTQIAGELPTLILTVTVYKELDIDLPDGVVIVKKDIPTEALASDILDDVEKLLFKEGTE